MHAMQTHVILVITTMKSQKISRNACTHIAQLTCLATATIKLWKFSHHVHSNNSHDSGNSHNEIVKNFPQCMQHTYAQLICSVTAAIKLQKFSHNATQCTHSTTYMIPATAITKLQKFSHNACHT